MISEFEDKGQVNPDITDAQKQDMLEFLFGQLVKDVATVERVSPFTDKKAAVESYQLFS